MRRSQCSGSRLVVRSASGHLANGSSRTSRGRSGFERPVVKPLATTPPAWQRFLLTCVYAAAGLVCGYEKDRHTVQAFGAICIFSRAVRSRDSWAYKGEELSYGTDPVRDT